MRRVASWGSTLALGLVLSSCAAPSAATRRDDAIEERDEARDLAAEIERAEATLAAHLEEPRCADACPLAERICALSERICGLSERHSTDDELAERCASATESCERAGSRVSAACDCDGG